MQTRRRIYPRRSRSLANWVAHLSVLCVEVAFKQLRGQRDIALIFHGTGRDVQQTTAGEIVMFDVLRVWKGTVPRRITIYNVGSEPGSEPSERFSFARDTSYFVTAYQLPRWYRLAFGLPEAGPPFSGGGFCSAHVADAARVRAATQNDPGHEPVQ